MSVRFQFGWIDAGASPDRLAQRTMAALSIHAGGQVVTAAVDRRNGIYSEAIVVPLFGVAEWLVANWWHLWHEVGDISDSEQSPAFESRHNLRFAADGFALPSLTLTGASGRMNLAWSRYRPAHARIEFIDKGHHEVERPALEQEFRNLIDAVLERLHGCPETGPAAEDLGRAWAAVNELDAEELEFSRVAALLGIDPFDVPAPVADALTAFWEHADPALREDALGVASADSLDRIAGWLEAALQAVAAPRRGDWPDVRRALPQPRAAEPWARGYALARAARERIGLDGEPFTFDPDPDSPLAVPRTTLEPPSARIHGLVGSETPTCVTRRRSESGTRFLMARALGDYLGRTAPAPGLLCSLATDRQKQSRAFAAELLAPAESLWRRIVGGRVEREQIGDLASEFGVSSEVVERQIRNHGLATIIPD